MSVIDLADRRPPVCYTVRIVQHWDGRTKFFVEDVADDERSRRAIAEKLREMADALERSCAP